MRFVVLIFFVFISNLSLAAIDFDDDVPNNDPIKIEPLNG